MKKVLVLAYDFPPLISIGAQRPYSWYRYLPEFGYQVTVVTRHWDERTNTPEDYISPTLDTIGEEFGKSGKIVRVPFSPNLRDRLLLKYGFKRRALFRKFLSIFYAFAEHILWMFDAKRGIYIQACKEVSKEKYDVIIATGEPFLLFRYAHCLAKKFNLPWIADYRDSWTTNQQQQKLSLAQYVVNSFFKLREQLYLSNATFITTPSPDYALKLRSAISKIPVHVIYNGYEDEALENLAEEVREDSVFTIAYAGTIYPHQNLEMFLDGARKFISNSELQPSQFHIRFYGIKGQHSAVARLSAYTDLLPYISLHAKIPYREMLRSLRASHILLLLTSPGMNWLNAKVFDYLAVRKPILLVQNDQGILQKLILENEAGVVADNESNVASFLKEQYERFLSGKTEALPEKSNYKNYSRKKQAENLASLLDSAI